MDELAIINEVQKIKGALDGSIFVDSRCVGLGLNEAIKVSSDEIIKGVSTSNAVYVQTLVDSNGKVVEVLTELNKNIDNSLSKLTTGLTDTMNSVSGLTTGQVLFSLVIVVVGALSAWLFNYLHWKVVRKTDQKTKVADGLVSLLGELEPVAIKYWLEDFDIQKQSSIEVDEIKLKSILKLFASQVGLLNEIIGERSPQKPLGLVLEQSANKLFDVVTGGDFETHSRKRSKFTASKISNLCAQTKMKIYDFSFRP
jgi:hypothetical protein